MFWRRKGVILEIAAIFKAFEGIMQFDANIWRWRGGLKQTKRRLR
jgi:hypothetical protein